MLQQGPNSTPGNSYVSCFHKKVYHRLHMIIIIIIIVLFINILIIIGIVIFGNASLSSSASSIHRSIDPSIYRRNDRLINVLLDQSIYWSVVRSLDRSIRWYIELSIYWYIIWAFDKCTDPSIYRSFNPSIVRLIYWSIDQSIHRSIVRSIYGSNPRTERSYIEDWRTLQAHASGVLGFSFACGL